MAYAKIATKGDVIPPFYITDDYVKELDDNGVPKRIEVMLGRSPPPGGQASVYDADFHIGNRMKISKKHAMIFWDYESQTFQIKSICKNNVKVDGHVYPGSTDGLTGTPCTLKSQACIHVADGTPLYFLMPKGKHTLDKPKLTYEQLVTSVLEPNKSLPFQEIVHQIQKKYTYYADESIGENHAWKTSLRTTLSVKTKTFKKFQQADPETGKKLTHWAIKTEEDYRLEAAGGEGGADGQAAGPDDDDIEGGGEDVGDGGGAQQDAGVES
jgi:hypothetical protein